VPFPGERLASLESEGNMRRLRTVSKRSVPPLESGDRLTRHEFERRYDAMPCLVKAELIDGVVYVPSPTRWNDHGVPHQALSTWLGTYWAHSPGVQAGNSSTLRLNMENEPQPDLALIILPSHGGQVVIDADRYLAGAPELVAEISASATSIDLNAKFRLYLRNRVREYLVWRVLDEEIDWFCERRGRFKPLAPDAAGIYRSEVFPGLWLDAAALVRLDLIRALSVLQQGVASAEHAAFVKRLSRAAASRAGSS
jgi:Uma2 family endonuclease